MKRDEWNRYHEQVTPWELKEYLTASSDVWNRRSVREVVEVEASSAGI